MCVCLLQTSSIYVASKDGHVDRVRFLVETGKASATKPNRYGMTPLHFAAMGNHLRVASYLMSKGASSRIENTVGQTAADLSSSPEMDAIIKANRVRREIASAIREEVRAKEEASRQAMLQYVKENWSFFRGTTAALTLDAVSCGAVGEGEGRQRLLYCRLIPCPHRSHALTATGTERASRGREATEEEEGVGQGFKSQDGARAAVYEDEDAQHAGDCR